MEFYFNHPYQAVNNCIDVQVLAMLIKVFGV